jgi:hypothetical protein
MIGLKGSSRDTSCSIARLGGELRDLDRIVGHGVVVGL